MKRCALHLLLLLAAFPALLFAQKPEAEATLERDQIRIGEQVKLHLSIHYTEGTKKANVTWPDLQGTLTEGVDIVGADSVKTALVNRASILYEQTRNLTLTSIDSGSYIIPPIPFVVNNDTVYSNEVSLYVTTIPVDTTKPIKDIKDIYSVPPAPPEPKQPWHLPLWLVIVALVVAAGIVTLVLVLRKKKTPEPLPVQQRGLLPHEKVLAELEELGRKKQWLHGELKPYHVALTGIIRGWIVERYRFPAREMTTNEIINRLQREGVNTQAVFEIERVLRTADLVKFAKAVPDNEENERVLQMAMNFVHATALYPQVPPQIPTIQS